MEHQGPLSQAEEGVPRRSPRFVSQPGPQANGQPAERLVDSDSQLPEVEVLLDQSARPSTRQSMGTFPIWEDITKRSDRSEKIADLLAAWTQHSVEMRRRRERLWGTGWKPLLFIRGGKAVEAWLNWDDTRTEWYAVSVDGAVSKIDETRLTRIRDEYLAAKDTVREHYFFLTEAVDSILQFCASRSIHEITRLWGSVINPISDVLFCEFRCAQCAKIRLLRHLNSRAIIQRLAPEKRRCQHLGVHCEEPVTETVLNPTLSAIERVEWEVTDKTVVLERRSQGQLYSNEPKTDRPAFGTNAEEDFVKREEETKVEDNTLSVLRAMGKQGVSVKPYDGTGGCLTLKVWAESLKRYLRLFNIKDGVDQVTVAVCFLEGKAKDWWDNACFTEQHEGIKDVEQLLHALQIHFRPLNEDVKLSLLWKNLQQSGDVNAYRQQVYNLRAQFPFGDVAEFSLAYHGLKKELRAPVLSELWKLNVRHLPLSQLFELAAQAEATSTTTLFPRFTERLRQDDRNKRQSWSGWNNPTWSGNGHRNGYGFQRTEQGWPLTYRAPLVRQQPTEGHRQRYDSRQPAKSREKTDEQKEWMRKRPCWICDKAGHLIRDCTKRKPSGCPRCGKDHQLRACPDRPKATVASISIDSAEKSVDPFIRINNLMKGVGSELLQYSVILNGKETLALVDTGAQLSLIAKTEAERLGIQWKSSADADREVVGADGGQIKILGEAQPLIDYRSGRRKELMFVAHPLKHPVILGLPWIRKQAPTFDWNDLSLTLPTGEVWMSQRMALQPRGMKLAKGRKTEITSDEEERYLITVTEQYLELEQTELARRKFQISDWMKPLTSEFEDVFAPLEGIPPEDRIQHHIDLVPEAKPVMKRPYRLAESQQKEVERQILNALEEGWIQPSFSPWGTAIFVVGKKNGEWRMCVDYRDLNALTEQDAYPLPRIDDILHRVASARIFTTLDLQSGYHQIQIRKGDRPKTAFRLAAPVKGSCHYEWKVMPFGLKNAPPTFQRYMSLILKDCVGFCDVYMDDIIVYSNSKDEHLTHVRTVLNTLREAKLKVKMDKCTFGQHTVEFLGHVLKDGRIWMRPEKQEAIVNWHEPLKTAKEVRQFLGLASYYRNYVKDFATIATPLIALTRKRATISWTWEVAQAFKTLKAALSQNIGRSCWDNNLPTRVTTDASGVGLGAVLEQLHGDKWETVAVWSRAMNTCQRNYSILDKEWLAILEAVTRIWKHWLVGRTFEIHTDHAPLVQILTRKAEDLTPRQLRWLERLESFSYIMKFLRGQENLVADALSREAGQVSMNAIEICDQSLAQLGFDDLTNGMEKDDYYQEMLRDDVLREQMGVEERNGLLFTHGGQLCVPNDRIVRFKLVLECHDQAFAGHWSAEKTLGQLKRHYFWPTMAHDVDEVVKTCEICQRSQFQKKTDRAPIRFIEAQYPWEVVTVDFVSGFAPTRRKHTAICVICDRFTRMVHAEPCNDHATAKETAKIMIRRLFVSHGCPRVILSDRGAQFDSELWHHFWNMLGTRVHLATTHHPQSNGLTERMNRTLIGLIRKFTQGRKHEWDEVLPLLEFAYNQTPNSTTGIPPFEAQQGYLPSIPTSLLIAAQKEGVKTDGSTEIRQFVDKIRRTYREVHELIRQTEAKHQEQTRQREDSKRQATAYHVGDEVLVYWEPFHHYSVIPRKQRFRYQGPFTVVEVKPPHCVKLSGLPDKMPSTINVEYIHLFKRSAVPELAALRD